MAISQSELEHGLRGLGLTPGETTFVHSSLSSIGRVDGGADAVVSAFRAVLGPSGTLAVPTFSWNTVQDPETPFDPAETPSETGAITEACRTQSDAVRSDHPTHSVCAVGADARAYTEGHPLVESIGIDSPLHRMLADDCTIVLLGVDHTANSAIHVAEKVAGVPYRDQTRHVYVADPDDGARTVMTNAVHGSDGFDKFEPLARAAGIVRDGRLGEAPVQLLSGRRLLELAVEALERSPGLLLCDRPDCERCAYARRRIMEDLDH